MDRKKRDDFLKKFTCQDVVRVYIPSFYVHMYACSHNVDTPASMCRLHTDVRGLLPSFSTLYEAA